ncbi:UNKNOWN [Stylonychia lemnae]|uniref:Uncharacterized protein n=1 Tax=Stylonychia lemnae TaxID=5949 RepID=A0A077ZPK5_STYLE|nr:UNKNOWN [Stylonychia lemnae]|eukprot:CDW71917.1 UNKNOWN [Stylonychia lemnae]
MNVQDQSKFSFSQLNDIQKQLQNNQTQINSPVSRQSVQLQKMNTQNRRDQFGQKNQLIKSRINMISGSNLEIVDQSSEEREEQQTDSKTNVNSSQVIKINNNKEKPLPPIQQQQQEVSVDKQSRKILEKSLGQLNQLVYSPYQIEDSSTSQIVLNQILQGEIRNKFRAKKRQNTRQHQKLENPPQELKTQVDHLRTTFNNRKASQQNMNLTKDPFEPYSSSNKAQQNKKFSFHDMQLSPGNLKSKNKLETYANNTQTTGFGLNQSDYGRDRNKSNVFTVHPLSSAGSSASNMYNNLRVTSQQFGSQSMSQQEYIKELERKLQQANERIMHLSQHKKKSSSKLNVFTSPKRVIAKNSVDHGSLAHIEQYLINRINNNSQMPVDEVQTERIDSKQFQEPEAEDKNDDFLSLASEKKEMIQQTVSNDSNLSNRNTKISSRVQPTRIEQFTQTRENQQTDKDIQCNMQSTFRRKQTNIIHQLSGFKENNLSFDASQTASREQELQQQVLVLNQQVEFLKDMVVKKDRDMRLYYNEIQVQKSKYESELTIMRDQQELMEQQLLKHLTGGIPNPLTINLNSSAQNTLRSSIQSIEQHQLRQ